MRFTYANDIAWKALLDGVTDYPDGAVFSKVGLITGEDPAFPSSLVPAGSVRYQLMVRDKAKHKDTDGWGYALFGSDGFTTEDEPIAKTQACHACHLIVPDRGYVFSKPMSLAMPQDLKKYVAEEDLLGSRLKYKTLAVEQLPELIKGLVPKDYTEVSSLQGDLQKHLFSGTLDEIRPALIKEMQASGRPAILLSEDKRRYSLVFVDKNVPNCEAKSGGKGLSVKSFHSGGGGMGLDMAKQICVETNQ